MRLFELWAPYAQRVRLQIAGEALDLNAGSDGWWRAEAEAPPGTEYAYLLDGSETPLPDPRSRWQPFGVHGPSRVYDDAAFAWTDQ
ncbi:MAG TPA: hypothetical protein VE074_14750, partial [Jatrophihabitantaceae bacterium]|nr:hypothetical protein [Jatrophihabitantaceae bacterium]